MQHRDVIYKIGVTGGEVAARIANSDSDPTYLFSEVDVVGTYKLFNINRSPLNINRSPLENLLH